MVMWTRSIVTTAAIALLVSGCVSDGPPASEPDSETADAPDISVTVPPSRQTPFCQTMIDLSDQLRTDDVGDDEALIISTYESIRPEVPAEISADFDAVLDALRTGTPAPTDPPLPTTPSTVPTSAVSTTDTTTEVAPPATSQTEQETDDSVAPTSAPGVDVGYAAGNSPSERINNYVSFECRDTQNNPGPPATQPLEEPPPTTTS